MSFLAPLSLQAQSPQPFKAKNALIAELGGKGAIYSVNYDRIVKQAGLLWSVRVGVMFAPETKVSGASLFLPIALQAMTGKGNHHLEVSLGETFRFFPGYTVAEQPVAWKTDYPITFAGLGYRFQKPLGGVYYSATLLPSFRPYQGVGSFQFDFVLWGGFGIGKSF